ARVRAEHRQGEPDELAGRRLDDIDRRRQRTVGGNIERRSVGHDARGAPQGELALLQQIAVDLQRGEAPGIWSSVPYSPFEQTFVVAVVLLEMVRAEEKSLFPKHPV